MSSFSLRRMLVMTAAISLAPASIAETVTRPAAGATRIVYKLPGEMTVRLGDAESVTIDAEPAVLPKIGVSVSGNVLTIASRGSFSTRKPLKVEVTLKRLEMLKSEGSGNTVIDQVKAARLDIVSEGSGSVAAEDVAANALSLTINGSGTIRASGSGSSLVARVDGTGDIEAASFKAQSVDATVGGSGGIAVSASSVLKATISGAGNITYQGNPKITESITGVGSIDRL